MNTGLDKSATPLSLDHAAMLAALGVVFCDIGTSPLSALRESFGGAGSPPLDCPDLLGVLSLILWALMLVISVKYLLFVLRADNQGEGGIIALVALLVAASAPDAYVIPLTIVILVGWLSRNALRATPTTGCRWSGCWRSACRLGCRLPMIGMAVGHGGNGRYERSEVWTMLIENRRGDGSLE